jgi:S-adenosylmethionine:tRNA ribosyltransferase-isomerase
VISCHDAAAMRVDAFDFHLPRQLIAERPANPRDSARLLHVAGDGFADLGVRDLPRLLRPGDVMVFNDTRVIPARLTGRRGQAAVEVTLHKRLADDSWTVFARPARKLRPGDRVDFAEGFAAEVLARNDGEVDLRFDRGGAALTAALEAHGSMPLPPYIRHGKADGADRADYQTVYARAEGAVAAPTAGLHFTPALLAALDEAGIRRVAVTLHVGAGTFLPVKADDTADHRMHAEYGQVSAATAQAIEAARAAGGRVVAVGTTALRLLESAAAGGRVMPFDGDTDIFITPGHRFRAVDLLMTNFHLPRSTLFMLVSAFSGLERMRRAYAHAMAAGYRFYSYGDSCLLHREDP